ncbi:MAG: hypothetical protein LBI36_01770 [Oscillospiraceae bacterium]|nr:hypothetical protein [Oscillospiraceae bacterium]
MELNTIINGDSLQKLKDIADNSIDLIFADPPYWMRVNGFLERVEGTEFKGCNDSWDNQFNTQKEYEKFTESWLSECRRVLRQPLKTLLTRSSKYGRMSGGERNGKANDDVWGGHAT